MPLKTLPFDSSRSLERDEAQRELLADAMGTGDAVYIAHAISVAARARGKPVCQGRRFMKHWPTTPIPTSIRCWTR